MLIGIYFYTKYFDDLWSFINKNVLVLTAAPDLNREVGYAMGKLTCRLEDFKKKIKDLGYEDMIKRIEIID